MILFITNYILRIIKLSIKIIISLFSTIRDETLKCIKNFAKKCGTPLHREVLDLVLDQITGRLNNFCKADNPDRLGMS